MPGSLGARPVKIWQMDPFGMTPYYDRALCQALARAGHEVCLFTAGSPYDRAVPAADRYRVDELRYGRDAAPRWWRRVLRAVLYPLRQQYFLKRLTEAPPDVVHFQWCRLPGADQRLIRQIQQRGIPVIHTIHDVEPLFAQAFMYQLHRVYALANCLVVHTQANLNRLLESQPKLADKTCVIHHPSISLQEPLDASRVLARRLLHIPPVVPVLLFFGSDRPYKGLDTLLEAVKLAWRSGLEFWLLMAGQLDKRRVLRPREAAAGEIIIHGEYIPSDEVWLFHRAADAAVFPYRQVSQSGGLITAMGFGLPVIVTAVGGMPETVNGNGWVVPAGDAVALSHAIRDLLHGRKQLVAMGQRSLELLCQRHAPELIAKQTLALYQEALGE